MSLPSVVKMFGQQVLSENSDIAGGAEVVGTLWKYLSAMVGTQTRRECLK